MSSVSGSPHGFQLGQFAVRWRCSRLRRHPWISLALAGAMLGVSAWVGYSLGIVAGLGALLVQGLATWSWWLPISCEAGPRGLLLRQGWRRRRLLWTRVRALHWEPGRCILGYSTRNATAERHLVLTWPVYREDVARALQRYLQHGGAVSPSTETLIQQDPAAGAHQAEQAAQTQELSTSPASAQQDAPAPEQNPPH